MGTGSVSNHLPGAARMQIRRPQRKRTQCSTVSLSGRPSQFSSREGYHGVTGTEAYGSRGSQQLAVVESIPTLPRGPLLCSHGGAASSVSRWRHAEKAMADNLGGRAASWRAADDGRQVAQPISSSSERAGDAPRGFRWAHSTHDVGDSTTPVEGRGPTCGQGRSGPMEGAIPERVRGL
jgi:hypothetical protein